MVADYPIKALMDACSTAMTAAVGGATAEHKMGRKFDAEHGRPPRYVWVPLRARERTTVQTRSAEEHRNLGTEREHFAVGCWGRDYSECWKMRRNLFKAMHDQAFADVRPEGGEWERASGAWNQNGELFVAEFSMGVPYIDAYTALDPAADEPTQHTVMPIGIEGNVQQTDDPAVIGETAVNVTTDS